MFPEKKINKTNLGTLLYLLVYSIFLARIAIGNTTFSEYINIYGIVLIISLCIGIVFIGLKIVLIDKIPVYAILLLLVIMPIFMISYRASSYVDVLILLLLLIGVKGLRLNDIVKCHLTIYLTILVLAAVCAVLGLIDNFSVYSSVRGNRFSLGNTYPTDFAAGTLYLMMDYAYLKRNKWLTRYSLLMVVISVLVYYITGANTSLILSIILSLGMILYKTEIGFKILNSKTTKRIVGVSFPILAMLSIYIQSNYFAINSSALKAIDLLLNNRIAYGYKAINQYGISLFGKRINMIGGGWGTNSSGLYSYVDNGYLQVTLLYGLLLLIFFCLGFMMVCLVTINIDQQNAVIVLIMLIIAVSAVMEPRFYNILYNPFIFSIPIYMYEYRTLKLKKKRKRQHKR